MTDNARGMILVKTNLLLSKT